MADMTKSIKEQTDKELDALILRLRKEAEAQGLVQDMKRRSTPPVPYDPYNSSNNVRDFSVSTEAPVSSLYHFGILGMKWGVRRQRGSDGRVIEGSRGSDDHKKARDLKKKGARNLSNAELKSYVERMNLEKQYSNLNKKEVSAGRKFVSDVLVTAGKTTLTNFVTKQMTTQLEKAVTKK
jgi:hypothetical protein